MSGRRPSTVETITLRGLSYSLRRWPQPNGRRLLLLHGVRDSSATFQFLVDELAEDWDIFAPDWRGHGRSQHVDSYWLHDLIGDLDALIQLLFAREPVPVVAHSLGGNVAGLYAGIRPHALSTLVSLDAFGPLMHHVPVDADVVLRDFLDVASSNIANRSFPRLIDVADRLSAANPRLSRDKAIFLATEGTVAGADGLLRWRFDQRLRRSLPSLRDVDEWESIWRQIRVPVLWLASSDPRAHAPGFGSGEFQRRAASISGVRCATIKDTGHNLHHDRPEAVAEAIESFLAKPAKFTDAEGFTSASVWN